MKWEPYVSIAWAQNPIFLVESAHSDATMRNFTLTPVVNYLTVEGAFRED